MDIFLKELMSTEISYSIYFVLIDIKHFCVGIVAHVSNQKITGLSVSENDMYLFFKMCLVSDFSIIFS